MKSLTLFNQPIRVGEDGMICLTDMWKASGKSDAESPYHYLRNKQTKEFLAELEKNHESVVFESHFHNGFPLQSSSTGGLDNGYPLEQINIKYPLQGMGEETMELKVTVVGLPTEQDMLDEFERLKTALAGRRLTPQLQAYILDELTNALMKKVSIETELV